MDKDPPWTKCALGSPGLEAEEAQQRPLSLTSLLRVLSQHIGPSYAPKMFAGAEWRPRQ